MSNQISDDELKSVKNTFWKNVAKYAAVSNDEPFVEEVAYMMVTLHRTGT